MKWRGTLRPQPSMRRMARLGSTYVISFGVTAGQIHSVWLTLALSQHAGDGFLPNTTAMHSFTAISLSALHSAAVSAVTSPTATAINATTATTKPQRSILMPTICLIKVLTRTIALTSPLWPIIYSARAEGPAILYWGEIDLGRCNVQTSSSSPV